MSGQRKDLPSIPVGTVTEPRIDMTDLKRRSLRGGAVTLGSQGLKTVLHLGSTVVLARLLSPDDYGVMAMVVAVTGFAGLFRDLGLSTAAVQKKELSHALQTNLFWINLAIGGLLATIVAASSPFVAAFYKKPELIPVTAVLSIGFIISSLGTQHGAKLVREMKFAHKEGASIAGAIVTFAVAAVLALKGFSYWSLVWSSLAGSAVTTLFLFFQSGFRPGLPSRGTGLKNVLKFGANVTAFELVNYFSRNLDNLLIGRYWGASALGIYSKAYALLMFPIQAIRGPITSVAYPAMSSLQDQPQAYRLYYKRVTLVVALLTMPITSFLACSSADVIEVMLGKNWSAVSPIFCVLAIAAFFQPPASLVGVVNLSMGNGKTYLKVGLFGTVITCIGFAIGVNWGPLGVAISYALTRIVTMPVAIYWTFMGTSLKFMDFVEAVWQPTIANLCGIATVLLLQQHVHIDSIWLRLILSGVAFCSVTGVILATLGLPPNKLLKMSGLMSNFGRGAAVAQKG